MAPFACSPLKARARSRSLPPTSRYRDAVQRPLRWNVGRGTVDEPRRFRQLHVEPSERRDEAVARRLAHRLLARPVANEALLPLPQVEVRERRSLGRGEEFARQPIDADLAVEALDVDADRVSAGSPFAIPINATPPVCET